MADVRQAAEAKIRHHEAEVKRWRAFLRDLDALSVPGPEAAPTPATRGGSIAQRIDDVLTREAAGEGKPLKPAEIKLRIKASGGSAQLTTIYSLLTTEREKRGWKSVTREGVKGWVKVT